MSDTADKYVATAAEVAEHMATLRSRRNHVNRLVRDQERTMTKQALKDFQAERAALRWAIGALQDAITGDPGRDA